MSKRAEQIITGLRAALAVAEHRPEAILRVFHTKDVRLLVAPLLKATAQRRKPYREVEPDELVRVAATKHSEGVAVIAFKATTCRLQDLPTDGLLMALDHVGNPHNLGALLRAAAWFGVASVIVSSKERAAHLSGAAYRVAQGAAELVGCCGVPDLPDALGRLRRQGMTIIGADQSAPASAFELKTAAPCCLVLGNETQGLSRPVRAACDALVSIPRSADCAWIESLNVSVAAGILLAQLAQRGA